MRATKDPVAGVDGSQATLDVQLKPVRSGALGSGWPGRGARPLAAFRTTSSPASSPSSRPTATRRGTDV